MIKFLFPLLISTFIYANEVVLTNFEGDVKVNDLSIIQKTPLKAGYKVSVPSDFDSFAVLTDKNGNRILIKAGELVIEKIDDNNNRVSVKSGEFYFHIVNPDTRLITSVMGVKTSKSALDIYGGDSYLNMSGNKVYYAVIRGKTQYEDPWGKITVVKSQSIQILEENKVPKLNPIAYKLWRKIKVGFERMGVKYLQ